MLNCTFRLISLLFRWEIEGPKKERKESPFKIARQGAKLARFDMSSTDERKIPKIVLKINRNETLTSSQEIEQVSNNSIFSTKAAQVAKEFYKMDRNGAIPSQCFLSV